MKGYYKSSSTIVYDIFNKVIVFKCNYLDLIPENWYTSLHEYTHNLANFDTVDKVQPMWPEDLQKFFIKALTLAD
jgi:hypothetical protein